jgi:pilus assembly protein CpaB
LKKLPLRTSKIYLLASIIAAALAAITLFTYLQGLRSRIAECGEVVQLVVVSTNLEAGEILNPSSISLVDFPDIYLLPGTFTDPQEVTGRVLLHGIEAGEPLLQSALLPPDGGGLIQSALDEDFRAYPLPIANFAFPVTELSQGSRVDVLAVSGGEAAYVLENIEIIGVSLPAMHISSSEESYSPAADYSEGCILLQITAEEGRRLAAAQEKGRVEILMRPSPRTAFNLRP